MWKRTARRNREKTRQAQGLAAKVWLKKQG